MKKLYWLLLCSLLQAAALRAQVIDSMRYQLDQVFANVDKSQIPTRLLDAYALPLVPLAPFNGVLQDSVLLNPDLFRGLYGTAYTACIYGTNPLPTLQDFNTRLATAEAAAGPATLPVMMQLISYATIRPEARSQNLLTVQNQQLYDVPGRYGNPYGLCTLFAAAPAHTYCPSGNVSLVFPSTLFTTYMPERGGRGLVQNLQIDFGDGQGYVSAQFDQAISAAYTTAGPKQVKVRYTYQYTTVLYEKGGQRPSPIVAPVPTYVLETRFGLVVGAPATSVTLEEAKSGAVANTTTSVVSDSIFFAAQPGQASGWAHIHYANGHTQLTKPLIVAKGFDGHYIAPDIFTKDYSIREFLQEIRTTPGFNFFNSLENSGTYDIVFINYTNGTDDILLNAGLFEAVLTYVNQHKDPSAHEQNVVMGLSMGGNIARYKLAEMTKANRPTDVRLLVLHDSPQRGANIPLGLSALVRQLQFNIGPFNASDIVAALKQANTLLDSPAAQQLLLYQTYLRYAVPPGGGNVLNTTIEFRPNSFIEGPYRQMITYQAPYKIVAVSQGSQCGNGLFAPYTELVRAAGRLNLYNLPFFLAGSEGINAEAIVNAIPANGQSQPVARLHVYEETQVFFGLIKKKSNIGQPMSFSCPAGLLPLDGASGGTEGIGSLIGSTTGVKMGYAQIINNFYKRPYAAVFSVVSDFCFIPTPSALDIQDFTLPSLSASYVNGVASVSTSRTDGFLAQERFSPTSSASSSFNQQHVSFTPRNTEWIYDQMERLPVASNYCSTECSAVLAITGPTQVCTSPTSVFSVNTSQVTWSASPSNYFTTATGSGSQFVTSAAAGAQGSATITATFPCGPPVTKTVSVGSAYPTGQYRYNGSNYTLTGTHFVGYNSVITMYLNQPYNFTFTSSDPNVPLSTSGNSTSFSIPYSVGQVTITATAAGTSSDCGVSGGFIFVGTGYRYMVAPNPAASELTVSDDADAPAASAAKGNASDTKSFQVDLYDTYGKKVKTKQSERGKAVLDVREVPDGLYNVRVGTGKNAYSEHVQITH